MAYLVKITGYSRIDGKMLMEMEPHWWSASDLVGDKRFVESRKGGIYCNYSADLSPDELRELHNKYKSNVTTIQRWLCFRFNKLSPPCQKLQNALFYRAHKYSHFRVHIMEWESGL